ncbi:hypothetical protein ACFSTH_17985 [Paenibacillus yanchengensis]|uniref:Uncharacterized protein n=1 Tax=Paenibacillus yanchengensis TaxID=2035833 RepID=A0ABW4YPN9_9BACL
MQIPSAPTAWQYVELVAQLADLKNENYQLLLTLSTMIELLHEKGIILNSELNERIIHVDQQLDNLFTIIDDGKLQY